MSGRNAWTGVLLGLLAGVALGGILLATRSDSPFLRGADDDPNGRDGHGVTATVSGDTYADSVGSPNGDPGSVLEDLSHERGNAIVRATRQVAPAVVSINVVQQQSVRDPSMAMLERMGIIPKRNYFRNVQNMGSGLIVSEDGLIVTNQHVVAGAVQIIVTLSDGRQYQAVKLDEVDRYDLAVLRIQAKDLPVARLAAEETLQIGEWVIAIGSPYGYLLADTQPTVTVGVISALNRDIRQTKGERAYLGMIQTDAAINPGNSGGPLVNTRGEVVGINTFIFSDSGGSVGIGFALPVSRVMRVVAEIRKYGHYRQVNLGFSLQRLSPGIMEYMRLTNPVGAVVMAVQQGSPVWKAGLRPGDIFREIEGIPLENLDTLYRVVYDANVGDRLQFRAERSGELWEGEILLEEETSGLLKDSENE
ncbi:MAG: trypsin-like peptidase domain-containing protein [Candidatus Krumholzibacteriota bacterium]